MPLEQEARKWVTFGSLIDAKLMVFSFLANEIMRNRSRRKVERVANRIIDINRQFPVSASDFNRKYGDVARIGKCFVKGSVLRKRNDVIRRILNSIRRKRRV